MNQMRYSDEPPTPDADTGLMDRYTQEQWTVLVERSLVVAAYDGDMLVGVAHSHGNGVDWMQEQFYVHSDYRGEGVGTEMRERLHQMCTDETLVGGAIRSLVGTGTHGFVEKMPGARLIRMWLTVRKIPS